MESKGGDSDTEVDYKGGSKGTSSSSGSITRHRKEGAEGKDDGTRGDDSAELHPIVDAFMEFR